jgi:hypothetical protein
MTVAELVIATVREARPKPQTGRPAVQTRPLARISHSPPMWCAALLFRESYQALTAHSSNRGKTPGADALFACADASMSDSSYA